jgi:hypothetical protein
MCIFLALRMYDSSEGSYHLKIDNIAYRNDKLLNEFV